MTRMETIGDCTRKRSDRSTAIYALCEEDFTPRYVGKTDYYLHVRHKAHIKAASRNPRLPSQRWIAKRIAEGKRLVIRLIEYVPAGMDWAGRERHWISEYRAQGHRLLNLTDGGEGLSGHRFSREHREKIAAGVRTGASFACETCGAMFWRKLKDIKKGDCRFCSRPCYAASLKGVSRPVSDICKERGVAAAALARKARTHCKRNHPLAGDNLFLTSSGGRGCKACRRIHKATHRSKANG